MQSVAKIIKSYIRRGADLVAHIGGEFAVIVPETGIAGAQALREQIRRQCRNFESESGQYYPSPTLSVGVSSCIPEETMSAEVLFESADCAIYKARVQGKDLVVAVLLDTS